MASIIQLSASNINNVAEENFKRTLSNYIDRIRSDVRISSVKLNFAHQTKSKVWYKLYNLNELYSVTLYVYIYSVIGKIFTQIHT